MRYVRAFGAFWYGFLIGDHVELFVGPLVALLIAWIVLRSGWGDGLAAGFLLFIAVMVVGGISLAVSVRPRR